MISILFENEHFVIAEKPAETLSVPSRFAAEDKRLVVGTELQKQLGMQIFPVHRLDYEVSGILLFAKNPQAHQAGNHWFETKKVQKIYSAVSEGEVPPELKAGESFEWRCNLLRGKKRAFESPHGKPSLTKGTFLGQSRHGLLWRLEPVTGRAHQLRFEMYRHKMPILGDVLYGSQQKWSLPGIALRACELHFLDEKGRAQWALPKSIEISTLE